MVVPMYDWTDFFPTTFKKIPGLKKSHHFRMALEKPGTVYKKERSDGVEKKQSPKAG